jgi:geranylgeranyl pyrophosphate synthase
VEQFVASHLAYVDSVVIAGVPDSKPLSIPAHYALDVGGKRLRPMLTLVVAESLGVPFNKVEPLIQAIELLHAGSLVFDDLPAQDNATTRRGKPTVHLAFNEWTAQLTGLSLVTEAFGVLTKLREHFPPEKVVKVEQYISSVIGIEGLCKGQALDLQLASGELQATSNRLLEMFHYKTSLLIEAALVPILILTDGNEKTIAFVKEFAHHAGIVYQIRDNMLDITSSSDTLGKDTGHDSDRTNFARLHGLAYAERTLKIHLRDAKNACHSLPFDTRLLQQMAVLFAVREK